MATWRKHCQEPWFSHIASGRKTVEGRCYQKDYVKMEVGDQIEFYNDAGDTSEVVIIDIVPYDTFEAYLVAEGLETCLPGVETLEAGVAVYRKYFTPEMEACGVVALHIKLVGLGR